MATMSTTTVAFRQIQAQHACSLVKHAQSEATRADAPITKPNHMNDLKLAKAEANRQAAKPSSEQKKAAWWQQLIVSQSHLPAARTRGNCGR